MDWIFDGLGTAIVSLILGHFDEKNVLGIII